MIRPSVTFQHRHPFGRWDAACEPLRKRRILGGMANERARRIPPPCCHKILVDVTCAALRFVDRLRAHPTQSTSTQFPASLVGVRDDVLLYEEKVVRLPQPASVSRPDNLLCDSIAIPGPGHTSGMISKIVMPRSSSRSQPRSWHAARLTSVKRASRFARKNASGASSMSW
jgi:hypothetical protein